MRLEVGIIALLEEILDTTADRRAQFQWLCNKPYKKHFGDYYEPLMELYGELGGDWEKTLAKTDGFLIPDAYFLKPYPFIFEFDELQHFTIFRKKTFRYYPDNIQLGYPQEKYLSFCQQHQTAALAKGSDRFRRPTADFSYINGRAAQRAFFDTFRDWLPTRHGLNPTVRIAEFEVKPILNGELTGENAKSFLEQIIMQRIQITIP